MRSYAQTVPLFQKECFDVIGLRVSTHQAPVSDSRRVSGVDRLILGYGSVYGHIAYVKLNEEADLRAR